MKRLLLVAAVIFVSLSVAQADEGKPMTGQGTWGWMFTFTGFGNITPIGGLFTANLNVGGVNVNAQGAGMRYYLANDLALRGGLAFGMASLGTKNSNTAIPDDKTTGTVIGLQAIIEKHMAGITSVSPYLAGGLGFQTSSYTTLTNSNATDHFESSTSNTQINLFVAAGFEWFVTNRISLGGEYQFGLGLVSSSTKSTSTVGGTSNSTTTDNPSVTTIGTNAYSPAFGNNWMVVLSVYP